MPDNYSPLSQVTATFFNNTWLRSNFIKFRRIKTSSQHYPERQLLLGSWPTILCYIVGHIRLMKIIKLFNLLTLKKKNISNTSNAINIVSFFISKLLPVFLLYSFIYFWLFLNIFCYRPVYWEPFSTLHLTFKYMY